MKTITFNSRRWDETAQKMVEHRLSFKVSDRTARMLIQDLNESKYSPFETTQVEGMDAEFGIKDEYGSYIYQAVRL